MIQHRELTLHSSLALQPEWVSLFPSTSSVHLYWLSNLSLKASVSYDPHSPQMTRPITGGEDGTETIPCKCVQLNHFAVQQKSPQHWTSTVLELNKFKKITPWTSPTHSSGLPFPLATVSHQLPSTQEHGLVAFRLSLVMSLPITPSPPRLTSATRLLLNNPTWKRPLSHLNFWISLTPYLYLSQKVFLK